MKELTKHQIERQDFVDNAIYEFIQTINQSEIDWDMEMIGDVRDVIKDTTYKTYIEASHPEVAANTLIYLIHQANYLLD
jgi:hypothetical protein